MEKLFGKIGFQDGLIATKENNVKRDVGTSWFQ